MDIPAIPFIVSLPNSTSGNASLSNESVAVAAGFTAPFTLVHPNVSLSARATVPALPRDAAPLLSVFVSSYLAGRPADIILGSPLLPAMSIPTLFPPPKVRPRILQDVAIRDMKFSFRGDAVLASGIVFAKAVLPQGIRLSLDVKQIWPDCLVFDGEVPSVDDSRQHGFITPWKSSGGDEGESSKERVDVPKEPLPSPLPARAFARIRPEDWLDAESTPLDVIPGEGPGASTYAVTARVEEVPLEVLPGRDGLMRGFVAKVLRISAFIGIRITDTIRDCTGDIRQGRRARWCQGRCGGRRVYRWLAYPFRSW